VDFTKLHPTSGLMIYMLLTGENIDLLVCKHFPSHHSTSSDNLFKLIFLVHASWSLPLYCVISHLLIVFLPLNIREMPPCLLWLQYLVHVSFVLQFRDRPIIYLAEFSIPCLAVYVCLACCFAVNC
jgi:hypothetical protein